MSAVISACGLYRMRLDRSLDRLDCVGGPVVAICGVNPSTADAVRNDHTIRKDLGFAGRLGWSRIVKANKFAFRAKDVRALKAAADPVGPENDRYLREIFLEADLLVAAWGPLAKLPPQLRERWREVVAIAEAIGKPFHCFGTAQDGQPRHTLMLPYSTPLTPWNPPI